jgi:Domain of unknown function (DUF4347)
MSSFVDPVRDVLAGVETSGEGSIFDLGTGRNALATVAMGGIGTVPGVIGGGLLGMVPGVATGAVGGVTGAVGGMLTGGLAGLALGGPGGAIAGAIGGGLVGGVGGAATGFGASVLAGAGLGGLATGVGSAALTEAALLSCSEGEGERMVSNDGGGDTGLWSLLTGEERGPENLTQAAAEIDRKVAEGGQLESFEIAGHGFPGQQEFGTSTIGLGMSKTDKTALEDIAANIEPGGEIVLGGCNIAETPAGIEEMKKLAKMTGHPVTAGVAVQMPIPGIEGTQVTVTPDGKVVRESSALDQLYDVAADCGGDALNWLYGTMA